MRPVDFDGRNSTHVGGEGVGDLPTAKVRYEDGTLGVVSAWEPSAEDLDRLLSDGVIYLSVLGGAQPPVLLSTRNPMEQEV